MHVYLTILLLFCKNAGVLDNVEACLSCCGWYMKCRPRTVAPVSTSDSGSTGAWDGCSACFQLGRLLTVIGPEAVNNNSSIVIDMPT